MPKVETWACKTCGKLRSAGNHWWWVSRSGGGMQIRPMGESKALSDEDAVCGREHVQREVELYLAERGK